MCRNNLPNQDYCSHALYNKLNCWNHRPDTVQLGSTTDPLSTKPVNVLARFFILWHTLDVQEQIPNKDPIMQTEGPYFITESRFCIWFWRYLHLSLNMLLLTCFGNRHFLNTKVLLPKFLPTVGQSHGFTNKWLWLCIYLSNRSLLRKHFSPFVWITDWSLSKWISIAWLSVHVYTYI